MSQVPDLIDVELMTLEYALMDTMFLSNFTKIPIESYEDPIIKLIAGEVMGYINKHSEPPTLDILSLALNQASMSAEDYTKVCVIIDNLNKKKLTFTVTDAIREVLVDRVEKWVKDRAVIFAVYKIVEALEDAKQDDTANREIGGFVNLVETAVSTSVLSVNAHDYVADADTAYTAFHEEKRFLSTGLTALDRIMGGGSLGGKIHIALAPVNIGKTTWLIDRAVAAAEAGANVFFASGETSEMDVRYRMDARALGLSTDTLDTYSREKYNNLVKGFNDKLDGNSIYIQQFYAQQSTVMDVELAMRDIEMRMGIKFDILLMDHLTLFNSSILRPSDKIKSSSMYYHSVTDEFRNVGIKRHIPVWSASQYNRDGQDGDGNALKTGKSFGIFESTDLLIAINTPPEYKINGVVDVLVDKSRYKDNSAKPHFHLKLSNKLQRYEDFEGNNSTPPAKVTGQHDKLSKLRNRNKPTPPSEVITGSEVKKTAGGVPMGAVLDNLRATVNEATTNIDIDERWG